MGVLRIARRSVLAAGSAFTTCALVLASGAAAAYGQSGRDDAASLAARLGSFDGVEREAAIAALAAIGPAATDAILDQVAATADHTTSEAVDGAIEALRRMGRSGAARLGRALSDERRAVRMLAAVALSRLGADAAPALDDLVRALAASPPFVASMASEALRAIGSAATPAVAGALGVPGATAAAAVLLADSGATGDPVVEQALDRLDARTRGLALVELGHALSQHSRAYLPEAPPPPPPPPPSEGRPPAAAEPEPPTPPQEEMREPDERGAAAFYARALGAIGDPGSDEALVEARRVALEHLVAIHTMLGEEAAAAPYVGRLQQLHPEDPGAVSRILEFHVRFGRPEEAERAHRERFERTKDVDSCRALSRLLARPIWGGEPRRAEALDTLEACAAADPGAPQRHSEVAAHALEWARRDATLSPGAKSALIRRGSVAADRALALAPDDRGALIYKALLSELAASLEEDGAARERLLDEAARLRERAMTPPASADVQAAPAAPPDVPAQGRAPGSGGRPEPKRLRDVDPVYPPLARQARVQGTVVLEVTIDGSGRVADVRVLRSVPQLDQAAIDAVRQWEYEPTLLNGVPVSVKATVTLGFRLD